MLRAFFGAFVLTLALPCTAPAAIKTGVTVLVHGFVALENVLGTTPYEYWGGFEGRNLRELLKRFGSGKVWEYDPASGDYLDITSRIPGRNVTWDESDLGQHILLFDWTDGSDEEESGQAEAAADALFASLMNFRFTGSQRIISISPYAALRPLHFIGHSRGTVVVSETVQRLGRYNIRVNYVTYLDIHDFGQPDIDRVESFHDPAVQVWENIDYVDAVYQTNAWNMCGVNPAGRRLAGIPTGTFQQQRDLTALTRLGPQEDYQCTDHERPHSWIKEYYWGTVALNGGSPNRPSMWYPTNGGTGSGLGFDRWWHQGGFDQGPDPSLQRVRCVVADDVVPYVWSPFNPLNENRASDRNDVPPLIFNGDFELPNLDGGIGGTEGKSLAGWYYFGGEGRAFVGSEDGNSYLDLGGNNALVAQHNRFFLPLEAQDLLFGINIRFVPVTPMFDEYLEVRIGSQVVRAFSITDVTDEPEPRFVNLRNFPGLLGRVNTLTFELVTALVGESPRVRLDNINIVTDPTSWIDSFYRFDQSNWRLIWRSWPSATITLEASSNLSTWAPIQSSSGAGDAGSFTIANTTGQRFFRLKAVPER